eukprot:378732-Amphidinium_carterae.1
MLHGVFRTARTCWLGFLDTDGAPASLRVLFSAGFVSVRLQHVTPRACPERPQENIRQHKDLPIHLGLLA